MSLTPAIIPVYAFAYVVCLRHLRSERRWLRHVLLPVLGIALLTIPVYAQMYPVPAAPLRYFPHLIVAFVAVSAVVATVLGRRRPGFRSRAGAVLDGAAVAEPRGETGG